MQYRIEYPIRVYYEDKDTKVEIIHPSNITPRSTFAVGNKGFACYTLAYAILMHHTDETTAKWCAHRFKSDVLAKLDPYKENIITSKAVKAWLKEENTFKVRKSHGKKNKTY